MCNILDLLIYSTEDKYRDRINETFSHLCVDMETASIAHVCYVNRIPYIAVRTVTDTPEKAGVEVFELNCEKASRISAELVRVFLRKMMEKRVGASH